MEHLGELLPPQRIVHQEGIRFEGAGVGLAQFCQQVRQGCAVVLLRFRRAGGKGEHQGHGNDGYVSDKSHFVTF